MLVLRTYDHAEGLGPDPIPFVEPPRAVSAGRPHLTSGPEASDATVTTWHIRIGCLHHYLRNRRHRSSIDLGAERLEQRRELGAAEDVDLVDGALVEDLLHHAPDLRGGTTSSSHTKIAS